PYFGSRTYIFGVILFIIVLFLSRYNKIKKLINFLIILGLLVFPLFIYLFISKGIWIFWGIDWNGVTSDRLNRIFKMYYEMNGLSLFPNLGEEIVDSGLTNILLKLGL